MNFFQLVIKLKKLRYLSLISLILLSGCKNALLPQDLSQCPHHSSVLLKQENISSLELNKSPQVLSGFVSEKNGVGYEFKAKKGDKLNYSSPENLCIWIYQPNQQILDETTLPEDGRYLLQLTTPKGSQTYEITLSLTQESATPSESGIKSPVDDDKEKESLTSSPSTEQKNDENPSETHSKTAISPQQTIENYFNFINQRNYQTAWEMLSNSQQNDTKLHPNGYQSYYNWWDSVQTTTIKINNYEESSWESTVDIGLKILIKSGSSSQQSLRFFLIRQGETWKINKVKLL